MKLLSQIKAFFTICGKKAEMKVSSAEIKQGRVFLHPIDDPDNVYCIKATSVDIIIDPQRDLSEDDILVVPRKKNEEELAKETSAVEPTLDGSGDMSQPLDEKNVAIQDQLPIKEQQPKEKQGPKEWLPGGTLQPIGYTPPKKKTLTVTLYEDEYDMVMDRIKSSGYHKAEFLLACVSAAKKTSWETTCKKYSAEHKQRKAADRQAAREARSEGAIAAETMA